MRNVILIINAGSSSMKFSIYNPLETLTLIYHGEIKNISKSACLTIDNGCYQQILKKNIASKGIEDRLNEFFKWFDNLKNIKLIAVGHRIVHGGKYFRQPTLINDDVIKKISDLIPLAPYHQAENVDAIKIITRIHPNIKQVACFDTTFHQTQEKLATLFAIPRELTKEGLVRYGFHGISYEYISSVINQHIGELGNKRLIVAHLGSGASMCAIHKKKSVATSMGFTALDGLMMSERCGTIDPGVILYLLEEKKWTIDEIKDLLYKKSGLLGVSNISCDMRELQSIDDPKAVEAIDLFCFIAAKELSSLCCILQGCDAIVFTAGIGEHSPLVRKKICDRLMWLGVVLDENANKNNSSIISHESSKICVSVIPTNEEYIIAKHTMDIAKVVASKY